MIKTLGAVAASAVLIGVLAAPAQSQVVGGGLVYGDLFDFNLGLSGGGWVDLAAVPGLRVGGDVVWYLPQTESFSEFGMNVESRATLFEVNPIAQYHFFGTDELSVYGVGGVNVSIISARWSASGFGASESETESETEIGLNLGIGGEYAIGGGALFGELRLVTGDWDRTVLGAGFRFFLN